MNIYEAKETVKIDSLSNLWKAEMALIQHKPIREPDYNLQQRVHMGKDVYEVGQGKVRSIGKLTKGKSFE
jgi:hypothetical protein